MSWISWRGRHARPAAREPAIVAPWRFRVIDAIVLGGVLLVLTLLWPFARVARTRSGPFEEP